MRKRETALNILLGTIVIFRWSVPYLEILAAVYGIGIVFKHLWPAEPNVPNAALWAFIFIANYYSSVRSRQWSKAFLALLAVAIPLSSWEHGMRPIDSPALMTAVFLLLFFLATARRSIRVWECTLLTAFIVSGVALNLSWLGPGTVLRVIAEASPFGALIWMVVLLRRGDLGPRPDTSSV